MNETTIPPDLLTPNEAAKLLGVSPGAIRRWVQSGKLPGFRLGGRLRVSQADAEAMLQRVKVGTGPTIPTRREVEERARWVDQTLRDAGVRK